MSTSASTARAVSNAVLCGLLCGLCLFSVSCDTTQPASILAQTFGLTVRADGATAQVFNVYTVFRDNDGDGNPDDVDIPTDGNPDLYLHCIQVAGTVDPTSFPFPYAIDIEVIRAGSTEVEQITSATAGVAPLSLSAYDETPVNPSANAPALADVVSNGDTYKFTFMHRTSSVNREVVAATFNPLNQDDPATYDYGNGLCSEGDPGPATIDGQPLPVMGEFSKGDTVVVRIRRGDDDDFVLGPNTTNGTIAILSAEVTLDGQVVSSVNGSLTGDEDPGSAFSFSLTAN